MTIYVSHSTSFDFKNDLYLPIRNSEIDKKHTFILPHETSAQQYDTKQLFKSGDCKLVIAECSYPSTGQGIELGWAEMFKIPIACIYKIGQRPSVALEVVTNQIIEYSDKDGFLVKISEILLKDL